MAGKKASDGVKQEDGKYKHTADLPKSTFAIRANSSLMEPEIQKIWEENQVFKKVVEKNNGANFILHDDPPYANGDLHTGHALNKILKDTTNRYKGISYAKLANLPPIVGLYSSFVPPLVYAVLGSSRDLAVGPVVGPVSIASLVLGSMLRQEVSPTADPVLFLQLAFTSTFFAGLFQASLGILRLFWLVLFLMASNPSLQSKWGMYM